MKIPNRNDEIAVAHALSTIDSTIAAIKAIDDSRDLVLSLVRATLTATWRGYREEPRWTIEEAVTDARGFLAAHIEEYALWEAAAEGRMKPSE
jgi:hypothetical protein